MEPSTLPHITTANFTRNRRCKINGDTEKYGKDDNRARAISLHRRQQRTPGTLTSEVRLHEERQQKMTQWRNDIKKIRISILLCLIT